MNPIPNDKKKISKGRLSDLVMACNVRKSSVFTEI